MIDQEDIPKSVLKALLPNERVEWIGQPARIPKIAKWFFIIFYVMISLGVISEVLKGVTALSEGGVFLLEGAPVSPLKALGYLLLLLFVYSFYFIWRATFNRSRYIVTNMRAFNYRVIWGGSWSWTPSKDFERNYNDSEKSPISGGFLTPETTVSRSGPEEFGKIEIGPLKSSMDDARTISVIKSILPVLDNIIYDPSNLDFVQVRQS